MKSKKLFRFLSSRLFITAVFILLQTLVVLGIVYTLAEYSNIVSFAMSLLSFGTAIYILNDEDNPSFKIAWLMPMLLVPILGWAVYLIFGRRRITNKTIAWYKEIEDFYNQLVQDMFTENPDNTQLIDDENISRIFSYITNVTHYQSYSGTKTLYFPTGDAFFHTYKSELRKAKHFIFIEYFIIEEGKLFDAVLDILKKKVDEGVEVRVMYDDLGTINTLKHNYAETLRKLGISASVFNPVRPALDTLINYRDHRKITVIDGIVAFTGGLNLADEYINKKKRFGYWKDCAIMLKGNTVRSMTLQYLKLWDFSTGKLTENVLPYIDTQTMQSASITTTEKLQSTAINSQPATDNMQSTSINSQSAELNQHSLELNRELPAKTTRRETQAKTTRRETQAGATRSTTCCYDDGPMDKDLTSEYAYMSVINNSKRYAYIITPYLILDNEMLTCLRLSAKSGVDVRIIVPGIPDKRTVNSVTKANYLPLINSGVRIYEYLPGFIHSKILVSDDTTAIIGTANFDFRSFYLHFENCVLMYKTDAVAQIYNDFTDTLTHCREITYEYCLSTPVHKRLTRSVLKLFSPFM
ncbi:hypothetical protein FACS1894132_08480 [Clostridia bacterium]|nr:hypothetical protein FACS1894132_08480 [Clostridia bacterium]